MDVIVNIYPEEKWTRQHEKGRLFSNVVSRKCPEFRRGCWVKGTQSDVIDTSPHSLPTRIMICNLATFSNPGPPATCPPPSPGPTFALVTCRPTHPVDQSTTDPSALDSDD